MTPERTPDYWILHDRMIATCNRLNNRVIAESPTFDADMSLNKLLEAGEYFFGVEDQDVRWIREFIRKTVPERKKHDQQR